MFSFLRPCLETHVGMRACLQCMRHHGQFFFGGSRMWVLCFLGLHCWLLALRSGLRFAYIWDSAVRFDLSPWKLLLATLFKWHEVNDPNQIQSALLVSKIYKHLKALWKWSIFRNFLKALAPLGELKDGWGCLGWQIFRVFPQPEAKTTLPDFLWD